VLWDNRRAIRRQLEAELQGRQGQERLLTLQAEFPALKGLDDWSTVFCHLLDRSVPGHVKDQILGALIFVAQEDRDSGWNTVLTLAFWPTLESIQWQKRGWDPDAEGLWHNLYWQFLEVVHGIDVVRRPDKIAGRVFNTTVHNLHEHYRHKWDRGGGEVNLGNEAYTALADQLVGEDTTQVESRADLALLIRALKRLRDRGILSRTEFRLFWAVDIGGQSVVEFASRRGLAYHAVKKTRQRALRKIRRHWKKDKFL